MNLFLAFFIAANLHIFGYDWGMPDRADWKTGEDGGAPMLSLLVGKEPPSSGPRRPAQFALAQTADFENVMIEADVKPRGRSVMIVFAHRDAAHFDYAHLSIDTGVMQPNHNGIFHVYGGERVRISSQEGPPAFAVSNRWYHVVLTHDGKTGSVRVDVDGKAIRALRGVDLSLVSGKVGLGSFDETADFKNVKLVGVAVKIR